MQWNVNSIYKNFGNGGQFVGDKETYVSSESTWLLESISKLICGKVYMIQNRGHASVPSNTEMFTMLTGTSSSKDCNTVFTDPLRLGFELSFYLQKLNVWFPSHISSPMYFLAQVICHATTQVRFSRFILLTETSS